MRIYAGGLSNPGNTPVVGTPEEVRAEAGDRNLMISAVAVGLAELGKATVASFRFRPDQIAGKNFGAIVLAAANCFVSIGRVQPDTLELDCFEITVEVGPERGRGIV